LYANNKPFEPRRNKNIVNAIARSEIESFFSGTYERICKRIKDGKIIYEYAKTAIEENNIVKIFIKKVNINANLNASLFTIYRIIALTTNNKPSIMNKVAIFAK
jgi:hypothetical protein